MGVFGVGWSGGTAIENNFFFLQAMGVFFLCFMEKRGIPFLMFCERVSVLS